MFDSKECCRPFIACNGERDRQWGTPVSCLLCFAANRIITRVVSAIIQRPEMKNQTFTPTFSAIGLLKSNPIGIVTEEIKVSTENARPIFSEATDSWI